MPLAHRAAAGTPRGGRRPGAVVAAALALAVLAGCRPAIDPAADRPTPLAGEHGGEAAPGGADPAAGTPASGEGSVGPAGGEGAAGALAERLAGLDPAFVPTLNEHRVRWRQGLIPPSEPIEQLFYAYELGEEQLRAGHLDDALSTFAGLRTAAMAGQVTMEMPGPVREATQRIALALMRRTGDEALAAGVDPWAAPGAAVPASAARDRALTELLRLVRSDPNDVASRWLLHVATAYLGASGADVPERARVDPAVLAPEAEIERFEDVAASAGLGGAHRAGGVLLDDLDGDGDLDALRSSSGLHDPLALHLGNGDGTFRDATEGAGLDGQTGGNALVPGDYDGDGDRDVLVLRGGGLGDAGALPLSLLRNEGDGRFRDVTRAAGLLRFHPAEAAAWGDLDLDGDLDLVVGNQTTVDSGSHPNEVFVNAGDGTFVERARELGAAAAGRTSGVALGDVDGDGDLDLYLTRLDGPGLLLRNAGTGPDGALRPFEDATRDSGLGAPRWARAPLFFDADDDGDLDLFVGDGGRAVDGFDLLLDDVVADLLGLPSAADRPRLFLGRGDGTFEDATAASGLDRVMLTRAAGTGDLDGDGRLDLLVATGDADPRSLVPNRAFLNAGGGVFRDATNAGGFGHLMKAASVAFGDVDGDGDEDALVGMGGIHEVDRFPALLLRNPGHDSAWIGLRLEGTAANREAIGARLRLDVTGPGGARSLHRTVGGGGDGSLAIDVALGAPDARLERAVVRWPSATGEQVFEGLEPGRRYLLREGEAAPVALEGPAGAP